MLRLVWVRQQFGCVPRSLAARLAIGHLTDSTQCRSTRHISARSTVNWVVLLHRYPSRTFTAEIALHSVSFESHVIGTPPQSIDSCGILRPSSNSQQRAESRWPGLQDDRVFLYERRPGEAPRMGRFQRAIAQKPRSPHWGRRGGSARVLSGWEHEHSQARPTQDVIAQEVSTRNERAM